MSDGIVKDPGCTCHAIKLTGPKIVALDWVAECPVHGTQSAWYAREGPARFEETRMRSIELQRQAREARQRARGA